VVVIAAVAVFATALSARVLSPPVFETAQQDPGLAVWFRHRRFFPLLKFFKKQ